MHSRDGGSLQKPPTIPIVSFGFVFQRDIFQPLQEAHRKIRQRRSLLWKRVRMLHEMSELQTSNFRRSRHLGFIRRPTITLAAYREIVPVILRLRFLKQLHELPPLQPARKQLACSSGYIREERSHHS